MQITADGNLSMTNITARASCRRLRRHLRQLHGSDAMRALSERGAAATTLLLSLLSASTMLFSLSAEVPIDSIGNDAAQLVVSVDGAF